MRLHGVIIQKTTHQTVICGNLHLWCKNKKC